MSKLFVGFWNRSVILTYLELLAAVLGIALSADGRVWSAVALLLFCGLCDAFDGKIARATPRSEDARVFGIQIDSLCDLVSFGVLPGAIAHAFGVTGWGLLSPMLYGLCAVIRLGYFNVTEQKRQQETQENRRCFEGLPVTWSSVLVPLICLLSRCMSAESFRWVIGASLLVIALLFIARIRVKKPQL